MLKNLFILALLCGSVEAGTVAQYLADGIPASSTPIVPTKGTVMVANGTSFISVGVGANGTALTANSATDSGLEWASGAGGLVAISSGGTGQTTAPKARHALGTGKQLGNGKFNTTTWTSVADTGNENWQSVCWSPELSLFCAVAAGGFSGRVMISPDGVTWTAQAAAEANGWTSVCWSPELLLFCAVSSDGTNRAMTSPDGVTWTAQVAPTGVWISVCWSPELTLFCAISVGMEAVPIMTSPDGVNWSNAAYTGEMRSWTSVCWSPELTLFCAVSADGATDQVMTSPDGANWTPQVSPLLGIASWNAVCWSPELGLFCAVNATVGSASQVMTSPDGVTWTGQAGHEAESWRTICWSPELSLFCAISFAGTRRIMTSPDGTTWTGQFDVGASGWRSICWSPELLLFCAIKDTGDDLVMLSQRPAVVGNSIALSKTVTPIITTGDRTINKACGTVNIAAAGTTVTVTNNLVTENSIIIAVIATADGTAMVQNVVAAAGSFVINIVASTGDVRINWVVVN